MTPKNELFQKMTDYCTNQFGNLTNEEQKICWEKFSTDPGFDDLIHQAESAGEPETVKELLRVYCTRFKELVNACRSVPETPESERSKSDEICDSAQWSHGITDLVPSDTEATGGMRCLGHACDHVNYKTSPGDSSVLWCSYAEKAVFYLRECPAGKWRRVDRKV